MRRFLIAALLMAPFAFTASALAAPPAGTEANTAPALSTSPTAPRLIEISALHLNPTRRPFLRAGAEFVVTVEIDAHGQPAQIDVVKSPVAELNPDVVEAVRDFRWTPGMVSGKNVPSSQTLILQLQ